MQANRFRQFETNGYFVLQFIGSVHTALENFKTQFYFYISLPSTLITHENRELFENALQTRGI